MFGDSAILRYIKPLRNHSERSHDELATPARPRPASEMRLRKSAKDRIVSLPAAGLPSAESTIRNKSTTGRFSKDTAYDTWEIPHLTKTPWELERNRGNSIRTRPTASNGFSARYFETLPREVYDCILAQLERVHLSHNKACPSCYLRDLFNLSLTSRNWDKVASAQMYRKIILHTNGEHSTLPNAKIEGTTRLILLRRTLRGRSIVARRVHELHLPEIYALYEVAGIEREEILNLVASLVMSMPNLERLVGFHIPLSSSFDRLSHALSTRVNLKEHVWLLADDNEGMSGDEDQAEALSSYYHAACDPVERFLELNANHTLLSTMVLHGSQGQATPYVNYRSIVGTLTLCPNLHHLAISGLAATSFTNLALCALPARLQSLRLENLAGVNDKGLQRFLKSPQATSIAKLTLINLELSNVSTVSNIFSRYLSELTSFTLVQIKAPAAIGHGFVPDFHSPSLRYLHWELRSEAGPPPALSTSIRSEDHSETTNFPFKSSEPICCLATSLLAASIQDGRFPALEKIRVPHDPQGVIQALCKPLATALTSSDAMYFTTPRISYSNGFSIQLEDYVPLSPKIDRFATIAISSDSRADSTAGSPTFTANSAYQVLPPWRSRIAAQSRILAAKKDTFMTVRVTEPDGKVAMTRVIGGFVGESGSKTVYSLSPDSAMTTASISSGSREQSEWVTGIQELVDGGLGEESFRRKCAHFPGRKVGKKVVRVHDLF